jgi:hypothetical protein
LREKLPDLKKELGEYVDERQKDAVACQVRRIDPPPSFFLFVVVQLIIFGADYGLSFIFIVKGADVGEAIVQRKAQLGRVPKGARFRSGPQVYGQEISFLVKIQYPNIEKHLKNLYNSFESPERISLSWTHASMFFK